MKKLLLIPLFIFGCSTVKQIDKTETSIETRIDTIRVISPEMVDSVVAHRIDSLTITGALIDTVRGDTIVTVRYLPTKEKFIIKKYIDTIYVAHTDTITKVVHKTQYIEEPTFLEQYWWLILIGLIVVAIIVIKLK